MTSFTAGSRRQFLRALGAAPVISTAAAELGSSARPAAPGPGRGTVRDRFWAWAHDAHVYDNHWGLPKNGRITPVEGAHFLGVPNIIFIRYEGKPAPPFEQYAVPFRSLKRVDWSIAGAGGATSDEEREHVFRLANVLPNLTGVFMDDFFQFAGTAKPQWLAQNDATFPVRLVLEFPEPRPFSRLELAQSDWSTGDYRSAEFLVEGAAAGGAWQPMGRGTFANAGGAKVEVPLDGTARRALRIGILGTHDEQRARSCGLSGVRLWAGDSEVPLANARLEASSSYPGHGPEQLLASAGTAPTEAAAALSVDQLRSVRARLQLEDRRLSLGVTLYTYQLAPQILAHLDLCDVISLWTWEAKDLDHLEANFAKFRALVPDKPVRLGCYMWDFGTAQPMPIARMEKQCRFGLEQLRAGGIDGMIFLATNICDLDLETVEWTRRWIAEVGDQRV